MSSKDLNDELMMERALGNAEAVRLTASPNPWVGSVLVTPSVRIDGSTMPVGAEHAEVNCLLKADTETRGSTLYISWNRAVILEILPLHRSIGSS